MDHPNLHICRNQKFLGLLLLLTLFPTLCAFSLNSKGKVSSPKDYLQLNIQSAQVNNTGADQALIDYFRQLFEFDWNLGMDYVYDPEENKEPQSRIIKGSGYEPYPFETIQGIMSITPILSPDNSEEMIVSLINAANDSLAIQQMYFYNELAAIRDAIVSAKQRGVNISIILEADNVNSDETVSYLNSFDINIKESNGTVPVYFDTQHNKGIIVDSEIVLISSINWSPTSLFDNREAGLIVKNTEVAEYYLNLFNHDWDVCSNYTIDLDAAFQSTTFYSFHESSNDNQLNTLFINSSKNAPTFKGNFTVDAMASPDNCYDRVAQIISAANTSIDLSVYTLSSPYILDILQQKLADGIRVRLLLEEYQVSSWEQKYNRYSLYNLTSLGIASDSNHSIINYAEGKWASSEFRFQHCKYALVDNSTLILSSGNWGRSSLPKPQEDGDVDGNRDWWITIYGDTPGILEPWQNSNSDSDDTDDDNSSAENTFTPEEIMQIIQENIWIFLIIIGIIAIIAISLIIIRIRN